MATKEMVLTKTKATKNKVVYSGQEKDGLDSVYIDKEVFGTNPPEKIRVRMDWDE